MSLGSSPFDISSVVFNAVQSGDGATDTSQPHWDEKGRWIVPNYQEGMGLPGGDTVTLTVTGLPTEGAYHSCSGVNERYDSRTQDCQCNDGFSRDPNTGKCVGGQNMPMSSQAQKGFWQRLWGAVGGVTTLTSQDSEDELELLELLP